MKFRFFKIIVFLLVGTFVCSLLTSCGDNGTGAKISTQKLEGSTQPTASPTPPKNPFEGIKVKAVYLTGTIAGIEEKLDHFIQLANTTEINSVVIDIKENGEVNYASNVPEVVKDKTFNKSFDPAKVIKKLHDNNIYVIGRIVCFRDTKLAVKRPDLAVKKPDGSLWKENGSIGWTNPYKEEVWNYNIDIAKEAVDMGFDEIQFDYVRFPTAKKTAVDYGPTPPPKADAISNFLSKAAKELHAKGAVVSADVFGIICESPSDGEAIGQVLERVGMDVDYLSPMVYPSHYANAGHGTMGNGEGQSINGVVFTAPDLHPYEVVYNTLLKLKNRVSAVPNYKAKVRPYLQDFTATYIKNKSYYQEYGVKQVQDQIKAVYDAGYDQWILWDGWNTYTEDALLKDKA